MRGASRRTTLSSSSSGDVHHRPHVEQHAVPVRAGVGAIGRAGRAQGVQAGVEHVLQLGQRADVARRRRAATVRSRTSVRTTSRRSSGTLLADRAEQVHVDRRRQAGQLEVRAAATAPAARPPSGAARAGCGPRRGSPVLGVGAEREPARRARPSRPPDRHRHPVRAVRADAPGHRADLLRGALRVVVGRLARGDVEVEQHGAAGRQLADEPAQVGLHRPGRLARDRRVRRGVHGGREHDVRRARRGCRWPQQRPAAAVDDGTSVRSRIR